MAQRPAKRSARRHRSLTRRLVLPCLLFLAVAGLGFGVRHGDLPASLDHLIERTATTRGTVATDVLNVREGPGTESAILGALLEGSTVEILGEAEGGFVPVRFGSGTGWMAVEYLEIDGQAPAVALNPVLVTDVQAAEYPAVDEPPADTRPEPVEEAVATADEPPVEADPANVQLTERWIDIDRSTATVTLYDGDNTVASFQGRIGRDPATDGFYSTAIGTYHVYSMNKGLAPTPFAEDTYLTDWVGFDPVRKNGIHSPVRDADGNEKSWQNATTLGCVRLDAAAARTVFDFAEIGMRVEVHD